MKPTAVHETDVPELDLPGRHLRWVITAENVNAKHASACIIRVPPGQTVKPAHSHPNGEEVIYVIRGSGRVYIEGKIEAVREGTTVLFPQGAIHMLQNTGTEEMKVICFFAPPSDLTTYKFFEDVEFPA